MLHWPIRVIRIVTDPVVDSIFLAISYLVLPSIARMLDGFFTAAFWALSAVIPGDALEESVRFVDTTVSFPLFLSHLLAKCIAEREFHGFSLEYCKRLHRLSCFKAHCRAKLQFDPVHYYSSLGIKAANCCGGRTLRRSIRQAG